MNGSRGSLLLCAAMGAAVLLGGCDTTARQREKELASIAKEWSLVIRASQVIPVYPMTEDLQPGDVFLVQRTVDEQHDAYRKRGFLALENHLKRLPTGDYASFYRHSFLREDELGTVIPRDWLRPGQETSFDRAPGAAFPAYSFSVSSGTGFSAALPIQGVPVGLSLLDSGSATGSVTIKDAHTYGLDIFSLLPVIQEWARQNTEVLKAYGPKEDPSDPSKKRYNYVRVVNRVYLAGKLNVSLNSTRSTSGGASVGVPKPVELPLLTPPQSTDRESVTSADAKSYRDSLAAINESLAGSLARDTTGALLPGATLKVVASSARSVSIDETFKRPVAIGYLGFDLAILDDGRLGPPVPTHAVLERSSAPVTEREMPRVAAALRQLDIAVYQSLAAIAAHAEHPRARDAERIKTQINAEASKFVPAVYAAGIWGPETPPREGMKKLESRGDAFTGSGDAYRRLQTYWAQLRDSAARLEAWGTKHELTDEQKEDLTLSREELGRLSGATAELATLLAKAGEIIGK